MRVLSNCGPPESTVDHQIDSPHHRFIHWDRYSKIMGSAGPATNDPDYQMYDPGWKAGCPPFDARYPHQNQYPNCLRNFLDFYRCKKVMGDDYVHCNYFKKVYRSKCNDNMIEKWEEQMENNTFAYRL